MACLWQHWSMLVSVPLMIECQAVITRPQHLRASGLSVEDVGSILDAVASIAEPVRVSFLWRPILVDPADDMVLEAAVNGRADMLVTFNRRDFVGPAESFELTVASPGEVVKRLWS